MGKIIDFNTRDMVHYERLDAPVEAGKLLNGLVQENLRRQDEIEFLANLMKLTWIVIAGLIIWLAVK